MTLIERLGPQARALSMFTHLTELAQILQSEGSLVVEAEPGSGKTTLLPLALLGEGTLLLLEPRRIAAYAAAERMASLVGERVGETVGIRTSSDQRESRATRILVITEAILARMLQSDPSLGGVGTIIFDEAHERSQHADLGLALALECRKTFRPDLKLVVASASLGESDWGELVGATTRRYRAPRFELTVRYAPPVLREDWWQNPRAFYEHVARTCVTAMDEFAGDLLCFLPGHGEIASVAAAIRSRSTIRVVSVSSRSSPEERTALFNPVAGERRIILATSVAETSITVPGLGIVVDSGLARLGRFNPSNGMDSLETLRVSRSSAEQRAGRAARLGPGVCIRLWSEEEILDASTKPEIERLELTEFLLYLAVWGFESVDSARFLTPPKTALVDAAQSLLRDLGAIEPNKIVATAHGHEMAALALGPRLSHAAVVLGRGAEAELRSLFAAATILEEGENNGRLEPAMFRAILASRPRSERRYARLCSSARISPDGEFSSRIDASLALAWPERCGKRIARERDATLYRLAGGREARIGGQEGPEWIVALDLDEGRDRARVFAWVACDANFGDVLRTQPWCTVRVELSWLGTDLRAKQIRSFGAIELSSHAVAPRQEDYQEAFRQRLHKEGTATLPWGKSGTRERLAWAAARLGEAGLSEERLVADADEWLLPMIRDGVTEDLLVRALESRARSLLGSRLRDFPPTWVAPSGRKAQIEYPSNASGTPRVSVRVQDCFGLKEHPRVGGCPLVVELLSPAHRPVQITSDVPGFWKTTWKDIAKEMRIRYPKHHWPDDPSLPPAESGARKTKNP